ncbi:MAG: ureidoglycolate lyase [Bacteroidota bacterium]
MTNLRAEALNADAFAPFGEVIEEPPVDSAAAKSNRRFDDLIGIDAGPNGRAMLSLLRVQVPATTPHAITMLERHPLGSQAFIPCTPARLLIAVAPGGDQPDLNGLRVFVTNGRQGMNYRRGVWHAPIAALAPATLMVIDRNGEGANCDIVPLAEPLMVSLD